MPRRPDKIVLASGNKGKLREFAEMLAGLELEVLPQSACNVPEAEETGLSFVTAPNDERHGARRRRIVDNLLGGSLDWDVHTPLDLDHTICLQSLMCE